MKARVIKEWEMYGITHKVGEIMTIPLHNPGGLPMISDRDAFLFDNGFIEEMKEPLIAVQKSFSVFPPRPKLQLSHFSSSPSVITSSASSTFFPSIQSNSDVVLFIKSSYVFAIPYSIFISAPSIYGKD